MTSAVRRWWWKLDAVERRRFVAGATICSAVLVGTLVAISWLGQATQAERARIQALHDEWARQRTTAPSLPPRSFTADLPAQLRTEEVVRDTVAWAGKFDLLMPVLTVQTSTLPGMNLQQATVNAELRGGYANLKVWLRELLARYPELALVSVDLQRPIGPADVALVASVQLRLFAKPKTVSASDENR